MRLSKIRAIYEKRKITTMFLKSRNEETKNNQQNRPFSSHLIWYQMMAFAYLDSFLTNFLSFFGKVVMLLFVFWKTHL